MSPARSLGPLVALALAACATTSAMHTPSSHAYAVGPRAPAEECRAFEGSATYLLDPGETTERQVLGLSCFDRYERPALARRGYVQLHESFDDRLFDPVTAAIMVVGCVGDGACRADVEPESLGQMVHYAQALDMTKLQVALQATQVPSHVQDAFVLRAQASKDVVLEEASRLDPRRTHLYVEVPEQVRARAKTHWQAFDAFYRRMDVLVPRIDVALRQHGGADHVQQQLFTEASKLRDDYLARCASQKSRTALECLSGPIARPLTQKLVQLAIRLGDPLVAQAENALLGLGPDQGTIAAQIATAQEAAVEEEQTQFERWSEAKADGVDEPTLKLAFGTPAPVQVADLAWKPARDMGAMRTQLRRMQAAVDVVRGTVRFVRPHGDTMEIYFNEDPREADCGDEDLPEGAIEAVRCEIDTRPPVTRLYLALNEAKPLLIGNRLEAVVDRDTHRAGVVQVFQSRRAENLVQLRAARWK